jgi:uncharacterized surface protein with fasciclin (FAS1) repeats
MSFISKPFHFLTGGLVLLSTILTTSCKNDPAPVVSNTITDIVSNNTDFTLLKAAVVRAGLADALKTGSLTVFAPNDAAFKASGFADVAAINAVPAATLKSILEYHVLGSKVSASAIPTAANTPQQTLLATNGKVFITKDASGVSVNGKKVITADVAADNGVIHVINGVLMPPAGSVVDLVTTSSSAPSFTLLTQAVLRAGIATTLASTTGVTIFAPTDAAFAAESITAATINALTPAQLTRILQYHIVPATVFSTNLTDGQSAPTLLTGATLKVGVAAAGVTVTGAGNVTGTTTRASKVITPNILTTTGVVHVIDRLLLPPA